MPSQSGTDGREANIDAVISAEQEIIKTQRGKRNQPHTDTYAGISISGGGIRSASFGIGVLQALDEAGYAERTDYLSTVSGGGYTGTAWTWFNYLNRNGDLQDEGYFFPFRQADGEKFSSKILSFIRRHRSYLVPGQGLSYVSAFSLVFRNALLTSIVYIALAVALLVLVQQIETLSTYSAIERRLPDLPIGHWNIHLILALLSGIGFVGWSILFGPVSWTLTAGTRAAYRARTLFQKGSGLLAWPIIIFVLLGALPFLITEVIHLMASGIAGFLGVLGVMWHFFSRHGKQSGLSQSIIINMSSALLIFGWIAFAWFIAKHWPHLWLPALVVGLVLGWFVNLNQYGLGRFYRDRLMETFLPDGDAVETNHWHPAIQATSTRLTEGSNSETSGPFHIINSNLILSNDENKKYRTRGGDNFIFTSAYCGSEATTWFPTTNFDNGRVTWPTAMATSGAAINPDAGSDSSGITRSPLVSFVMFALGLRLGTYLGNPDSHLTGTPNLLRPGIRQGLFDLNFKRQAPYFALSDGGHFDNTAVYELIRRRLDLIICSEAGQDEDYSFCDIANLAEKIRVDFGVELNFMPEYDLPGLMPGSYTGAANPMSRRYHFAERGFALATINYPQQGDKPASEGLMVFVKATLTEDLTPDIYGYRNANPTFPNQPTTDQFFDEPQFEAYRELGYQLTKQLTSNQQFSVWSQTGEVP